MQMNLWKVKDWIARLCVAILCLLPLTETAAFADVKISPPAKPKAPKSPHQPTSVSVDSKLGRSQADGQLHLVIIGIDKYKNDRLNLALCVNDARAVRQAFTDLGKKFFRGVHVYQLVDSEATFDKVNALIENVSENARPQDTFVFFFSGVGGGASEKWGFAAHDYESEKNTSFVSANQIGSWSARIQSNQQVFILDTDNSAAALPVVESKVAGETSELKQLMGRNIVLIGLNGHSSEELGKSKEDAHGTLTRCILKAIDSDSDSSRDGFISIGELCNRMVSEDMAPIFESGASDSSVAFKITGQNFIIGEGGGGAEETSRRARLLPVLQWHGNKIQVEATSSARLKKGTEVVAYDKSAGVLTGKKLLLATGKITNIDPVRHIAEIELATELPADKIRSAKIVPVIDTSETPAHSQPTRTGLAKKDALEMIRLLEENASLQSQAHWYEKAKLSYLRAIELAQEIGSDTDRSSERLTEKLLTAYTACGDINQAESLYLKLIKNAADKNDMPEVRARQGELVRFYANTRQYNSLQIALNNLLNHAGRPADAKTAQEESKKLRGSSSEVPLSVQRNTELIDEPKTPSKTEIPTGTAVFFATDEYQQFAHLNNPLRDANAICDELRNHYGWKAEVSANPTKDQIVNKLFELKNRTYAPNEQLLVYFAGHGFADIYPPMGFIVTNDSIKDDKSDRDRSTMFDYYRLRVMLDNMDCRHILLVTDVCFGGTFLEQIKREAGGARDPRDSNQSLIECIQHSKPYTTRKFLTSGRDKPVWDGPVGGHSPFASKLLEALRVDGARSGYLSFYDLPSILKGVPPGIVASGFGKDEPGSDILFIRKTASE